MTETTILPLLLFIGIAAHFLKKLRDEHQAGRKVTLRGYWIDHPYHSALSITLSIGGFVMFWGTPELTRLTAFLWGYASDSFISVVMGNRYGTKVSADTEEGQRS